VTVRQREPLDCCGVLVWPGTSPFTVDHKDGCKVPLTARYRAGEAALAGSDTVVVVWGVICAAEIYEPIISALLRHSEHADYCNAYMGWQEQSCDCGHDDAVKAAEEALGKEPSA